MRNSQQSVFGLTTEVCPWNTDLTFKCLMTWILLKNGKKYESFKLFRFFLAYFWHILSTCIEHLNLGWYQCYYTWIQSNDGLVLLEYIFHMNRHDSQDMK